MTVIHIDKLYRSEHKNEPCFIGFPLPAGILYDPSMAKLSCNGQLLPVQAKKTAAYADGSVKYLSYYKATGGST